MFFFLSKALFFLIQPINWIVFFIILGLLSKNPIRRKRRWNIAFGLFFIFTSPLIVNLVVGWWEMEGIEIKELKTEYDVGIVLGGYVNMGSTAPKDRINFNERSNRLVNAVELYKIGKVKHLLLSGASGKVSNPQFKPAEEILVFLDRLEVPDSSLIIEPQSRNTYENIFYSKQLIKDDQSVLLITSGFHMKRALAICEKQGLQVDPYPTDIMYKKQDWAPRHFLLPHPGALEQWDRILKEWVGMLAYKVKGYV